MFLKPPCGFPYTGVVAVGVTPSGSDSQPPWSAAGAGPLPGHQGPATSGVDGSAWGGRCCEHSGVFSSAPASASEMPPPPTCAGFSEVCHRLRQWSVQGEKENALWVWLYRKLWDA